MVHSAKNGCLSLPSLPCNPDSSGLVVGGSVGAGYDLYLLVLDGSSTSGVAGVAFGIDYDPDAGSGMDVFAWTRCADLEFPGGPAGSTWPGAGTGNAITWDRTIHCQDTPAAGDADGGVTAVLGMLYVYAYGDDEFAITPRTYVPVPDLSLADCGAEEHTIEYPGHAGTVGFGAPAGFDPCDPPGDSGDGDGGDDVAPSGDPSRELHVFFKSGQVRWPPDVSSISTADDYPWFDDSLRSTLRSLGVEAIRPHRQARNPDDGLEFNRFGIAIRKLDYDRIGILTCESGRDRDRAIRELQSSALVDHAWPAWTPPPESSVGSAPTPRADAAVGNPYCYFPDGVYGPVPFPPGDPAFFKQWNMHHFGQCGWGQPFGPYGPDANAPEAWNITTGDASIVLALVDVGAVDWTHPEFAGRVAIHEGPIDDHATKVAGIAAATGGNGTLIAGMDWNCTVHSYPGHGDRGGTDAYIDLATSNGANTINLSIGGMSEIYDPEYASALKNAYMNGVFITKSMPDSELWSPYPNRYLRGLLNVQGLSYVGYMPSYVLTVLDSTMVDLSAPGGDLWDESYPVGILTTDLAGDTAWAAGTSLAAPHAAGAGTLLLARAEALDIDLLNDDIQALLKMTAETVEGGLELPVYFGAGLLRTDSALVALEEGYLFHETFEGGGLTDTGVIAARFVGEPKLADHDMEWRDVLRTRVESRLLLPKVRQRCSGAAKVWGVGSGTSGYEKVENLGTVLAAGWCSPEVPVDLAESTYLTTFVYGQCPAWPAPCNRFTVTDWYPVSPDSVQWTYSALC